MIEEEGHVVELRGPVALIKARRNSSCEGCVTKELCHPSGEDDMQIEATNEVGAMVGDEVIFTIATDTVLKAGMMLYLLPLAGFVVGVVLGQVLGPLYFAGINADIASGILGLVFVALTFLALKGVTKRGEQEKRYTPTIVRVVRTQALKL